MATQNLTPEQLSAYQKALADGKLSYTDPTTGLSYGTMNNSGMDPSVMQMMYGDANPISVGNHTPGGGYSVYNSQGADTGKTSNYGTDGGWGDILKYSLPLLGVGAMGGMFAGGLAGMGGGTSLAGDAFMPGALGADGAFMSTAALPGTALAGGGGAMAGLGSSAGMTAPAGLGAQSAGTGIWSAGSGMGLTGTLLSGAGGASSLLGGASSVLGPVATLLGGAAGASKPPGTDVQKTMDPRLDALVYGDNGLLSRTQDLLGQQMDPARSQGWRDMQAKGQGLLQQPIAGNGFERFYGGR